MKKNRRSNLISILFNFNDLFLEGYSYDNQLDQLIYKELNDLLGSDEKVSITQSLGCDKEEAKKNKKTENKILTPKTLIARLPVSLSQISAGNSSCKRKNKFG